jgi:predicted nucleic acid-binding protein
MAKLPGNFHPSPTSASPHQQPKPGSPSKVSFIDADCLIAGVLTSEGATSRLLDRWQGAISNSWFALELVNEVRKALVSPRLAHRYEISEPDADAFARKLTEEDLMLEDPKDPLRVVPHDSKDDYLVALAIESGTLVTRDRHLDKVIVEGDRIITAREALAYSILNPAHPPPKLRGDLTVLSKESSHRLIDAAPAVCSCSVALIPFPPGRR